MDMPNFNNLHKGRRAWILTTSWSIGKITPEQWAEIDKDVTVGVNNICAFRPVDYLCFIDWEAYATLKSVRQNTAKYAITRRHNKPVDLPNLVIWGPRKHEPTEKFEDGYYAGGTTTHMAINLALVMGCDPIIILGLDFEKSVHIRPQPDNDPIDDPDKPYIRGSLDDNRMVIGYKHFAQHAKNIGRTIINGYETSPLKCFEKQSVQEILKNGRYG